MPPGRANDRPPESSAGILPTIVRGKRMAAIRCGMVAVMIAGMLLIFFALVMLLGGSLAINAEDKVALGT